MDLWDTGRLTNRASLMLCFSLCAWCSQSWKEQEKILGQILSGLPASYLVHPRWASLTPWGLTSQGFYCLSILLSQFFANWDLDFQTQMYTVRIAVIYVCKCPVCSHKSVARIHGWLGSCLTGRVPIQIPYLETSIRHLWHVDVTVCPWTD